MKPMHSIARIRQKVREALNLRPGFGKTEKLLLEAANDLLGGGVSLQELRDALEWNHGKGFVRSRYDDASEETLWFITAAGQAQEEIK